MEVAIIADVQAAKLVSIEVLKLCVERAPGGVHRVRGAESEGAEFS